MLLFAMLQTTEAAAVSAYDLESLLTGVANGSREAFSDLYEQTRGKIYAFALSYLHNCQDAEDATQDTYLKIRTAAHLYVAKGKPMAWILTIAKNICLMQLRQQKRSVPLEPEADFVLPELRTEMDADDRMVLQAAFQVLSKEERSIILQHAAAGLKHREIAAQQGLPLSTVLSRYNRGIKKLQHALEGIL